MKKVFAMVLVMALCICVIFAQGAAENPAEWAKIVDVVVPASAGGGTDLVARAFFDSIAKSSGNNIAIVNNTEGNCVVAFETVRNAEPDGSKILFFNGGFLTRVASGIYDKSVEDFKVIAATYGQEPSYALLVSADSKYKTIEELDAAVKANPGELLFGCNIGGTTQVMGMELAGAMGGDFKYVHSGSDTTTLTELVGGNIDVCYANVNQARQYVESGKAIALGILGQDLQPTRSSVLPEIPNMVELGYDVCFKVYLLVLGPKTMSDELALKIHDYLVAANSDPAVIEILTPGGFANQNFVPFDEAPATVLKDQQSYVSAFK